MTWEMIGFGAESGPGWAQVVELAVAFGLSALIGLEREVRQKSAGLRTHTIVGGGAALFVLISKYGFSDIVGEQVSFDPSRVAAGIVTGIGFIGGGVIFVRRDAVRGLTTAAVVWLTASVGMAAGAGLLVLAVLATGGHFLVVFGLTPLARRLPRSRHAPFQLRMSYREGVLRNALVVCTERGFTVGAVSTASGAEAGEDWPGGESGREDHRDAEPGPAAPPAPRVTAVVLELAGTGSVSELAAALSEVPGVLTVSAGEHVLGSE